MKQEGHTFLTETLDGRWCGVRILALDWDDAESVCPDDLRVIGILIEEVEFSDN